MKLMAIPALLPMVLLIGCAATPASKVVEAAPPTHSVNRYELHGSPDKVALLVDSETGAVWQYEIKNEIPAFQKVSVEGLAACSVAYNDAGKIYDIPCAKQLDFLKAHPNAVRM